MNARHLKSHVNKSLSYNKIEQLIKHVIMDTDKIVLNKHVLK